MQFLIFFIVSFIVAPSFADSKMDCSISSEETARLLNLEFKSFDQDLSGGGWRKYGDSGCYLTAASLLDAYREGHAQLAEGDMKIINFHAGQMYAFGNSYELAILRFQNSYDKNEKPNAPFLWNAY